MYFVTYVLTLPKRVTQKSEKKEKRLGKRPESDKINSINLKLQRKNYHQRQFKNPLRQTSCNITVTVNISVGWVA
jgi:hypothetical protein